MAAIMLVCISRLILSHTDELPDGPTEGGLPWSTGACTGHSLPHPVYLLQETSQHYAPAGNLQVSSYSTMQVSLMHKNCFKQLVTYYPESFAFYIYK